LDSPPRHDLWAGPGTAASRIAPITAPMVPITEKTNSASRSSADVRAHDARKRPRLTGKGEIDQHIRDAAAGSPPPPTLMRRTAW